MTAREKRLMEVLFQGGATEQDISLFTEGLDVDTESSDYMLMLSYLGISNGWKWFPEEIIPRLKGLHRYYQARNVMGIKGLLAQLDLLLKAGIPVMLIKGMAIRYHYAVGVPRIMSDMDLLVPEEQFERAVSLLCANGAERGLVTQYSIHILNGISSIDLHRWFFKHCKNGLKNVWERAIPIDFYGRRIYVPSPEDMFVHQLDTRARAIFVFEAEARRMRWLYDCKMIGMRGGFDWELVMQRIQEFSVENTTYFMLKAFSDCFPDMLSASVIEAAVTPTEDYEKWLRRGMRWRYCEQKIHEAEQKKRFFRYVRFWVAVMYYDYREKEFSERTVHGVKLSVLQYVKESYTQETVLDCIKLLSAKAVKRIKMCVKGDRVGADN